MNHSQAINHFIANDYITRDFPVGERSRLLADVRVERLDNDQIVYAEGDIPDDLYYLAEGRVEVSCEASGKAVAPLTIIPGQYFGHEAGAVAKGRVTRAVTLEPSIIIRIPGEQLNKVFKNDQRVSRRFILDLFSGLAKLDIRENFLYRKITCEKPVPVKDIFGWLFTIFIPFILYFSLAQTQVGLHEKCFLSTLGAALSMWIFELVPAWGAGVFLMMAFLAMGIAPPGVVLGGFSSETFFMALSIYALGTAFTTSGLMYRILLVILKYMPSTVLSANVCLFVLGLCLSLFTPSTPVRIRVMSLCLLDMARFTHVQPGSRDVSWMSISCFTGASLFGSVFVSASLYNFILLGLLVPQDQERFQWLGWLQGALATGAILFAVYLMIILVFGRRSEKLDIDRQRIYQQYKILGPMGGNEKASLYGVAVFLLGIASGSYHFLTPASLGMIVLFMLVVFNALGMDRSQGPVDWYSLFLLGSLLGTVAVFNFLDLAPWLVAKMSWAGQLMKGSVFLFIVSLSIFMGFIRLFVPYPAAVVFTGAILVPVAQEYEVSTWLVSFVTLVSGQIWFLPYQYPPFRKMRDIAGETLRFNEGHFLACNLVLNFLKVGALLLSIPWWEKLGLL